MGPAGSGKSTFATQFLSPPEQGEPSGLFPLRRKPRYFQHRSTGMDLDLRPFISSGLLELFQMDPAALSPGEFAGAICHVVERGESRSS